MAAASRLRALVPEHLGLLAVSLLLTVLLWLVVGARVPGEASVSIRVEPVLDSSLALLDPVPDVRALVAGRTADLMKLYASPPVMRPVVGAEVPDTLILDVAPADIPIPADLVNHIRVLDVQPRQLRLRFASRARRALRPMPLLLAPPGATPQLAPAESARSGLVANPAGVLVPVPGPPLP